MSAPVAINWKDEATRRYLTGSVARPGPGEPRRCFYVDGLETGPGGIVPVLVTEAQPGYRPMRGAGNGEEGTWYWGETIAEAQEVCRLVNAEVFGLDDDQAQMIVGSSIVAQRQADAAAGMESAVETVEDMLEDYQGDAVRSFERVEDEPPVWGVELEDGTEFFLTIEAP